ncbi:carbohydrate ABC transporter permease [Streptomyces sp. NPDC001046]|uniref:carbohydrate ABC transporter permease n=1 Tax=Streptomyces sp. NPDC001046 TaxID=3364543 RepID=UPI0036B1A8CE
MSRYSANRPAWMEKPSLLARSVKFTVLAAVLVAVVFPFLVVLSTSVSSQEAISRAGGMVVLPTDLSFAAYNEILGGGVVSRAVVISIVITVVGTLLSVSCTVLAAYGLSRRDSFGHGPLLTIVLLTLLFTPGIIPSYLVVKELGLLDSYWALILPTAINAFNLVILRNFFLDIPAELREAARIDGAGEFMILRRVVLPLSKAIVAVIAMFYGVAYWNSFFSAMLYMTTESKWPLQLVLRVFVLEGQDMAVSGEAPPPQQALQMAIVVVAVIPVLIAFPFVQRHFTKGVITGAIKG